GVMAPGPGGTILYIVDYNPANSQVKIVRYNTLLHQILAPNVGTFVITRTTGVFDVPSDVVVGPDGNIYVSDSTNRSVVRISGTTGLALPAPGQSGAVFVVPGTAGVLAGFRMAFGPDGNLN